MNNLFNAHFTFNTTGSMNSRDNFRAHLDKNGNIIDNSKLEYGYYNYPISINFSKLLLIKRHSIGLGDIIDFFTKKLYIKNFIMFVTKGNCGCEERRVLFNKWFKFVWFSLSFRPLYLQDSDTINRIKYLRKNKINITPETPAFRPKLPTRKDVALNEITEVNGEKPNPVKPEQIKKSCGCSRGKK